MKIVAWNCNMAFRKKFMYMEQFKADIYVISECEDPRQCNDLYYKEFASNHLWLGTNKHKGLGVFCKPDLQLSPTSWFNDENKYILPVSINNEFVLVACWICNNELVELGYYGAQFWKFIQEHKHNLANCVIAGDFNNNKIWDKKSRYWNHTDSVKDLEALDIISLYHLYFNELQGCESKPTLYMQRNKAKPYHIDYAFASKELFKNNLHCHVGCYEDWIQYSDHMPIVIEF